MLLVYFNLYGHKTTIFFEMLDPKPDQFVMKRIRNPGILLLKVWKRYLLSSHTFSRPSSSQGSLVEHQGRKYFLDKIKLFEHSFLI